MRICGLHQIKNEKYTVNCKNYKTLKLLISLICRENVGLKRTQKICKLKFER